MIRISGINYPPQLPEEKLAAYVAKKYKIKGMNAFSIYKQSIDARKKTDIHYVYTVDVGADNEGKLLKTVKNASRINDRRYRFPEFEPFSDTVVIVGFGPAGMMCAHTLACHGV